MCYLRQIRNITLIYPYTLQNKNNEKKPRN